MTQVAIHEIVMPRLTDSMEEGTVLKWLKEVGDAVEKGEPIVEIETDKATMPCNADGSGTLAEIVVGEGETVPIGTTIALLGDPAAVAERRAAEPEREPQPDAPPAPQPEREPQPDAPPAPQPNGSSAAAAAPARSDGRRAKASPVARRMANANGIELTELAGSGFDGRITKADVERALAAATAPEEKEEPTPTAGPAPREAGEVEGSRGASERLEMSRLQQTIARRMAESKATVPDFQVRAQIDMGETVAFRERLKALPGDSPVPSLNDIVIKACALALRDFPRVNSSYGEDGSVLLHPRINVGFAVAVEDGLFVPTIFDADRQSLGEIARASRRLAQRTRDGEITPPELAGGTFTVSNLGMYGVDSFTPVINLPQVALLAVGALQRRPVVDDDGKIGIRQMVTATLACDHRVLYGAEASQFLGRLRSTLEQPLLLTL